MEEFSSGRRNLEKKVKNKKEIPQNIFGLRYVV
jgi:hypothetical protein